MASSGGSGFISRGSPVYHYGTDTTWSSQGRIVPEEEVKIQTSFLKSKKLNLLFKL